MADNSAIEWTDHSFNPWWGCARVSPACRFCYADSSAQRYGFQLWRRHGGRRMLSDPYWRRPLKWDRDAEKAGVPARVFCASMADVFEDHPQLGEPRERLWELIEATPWLRWQLLTKRPENVARMAPWGGSWPAHVWLGVSVENQRFAAARIPRLLSVPARVRFLSCEPLLEELDLREWFSRRGAGGGIDWVISGGESGPKARMTEERWIRSVVEQCRQAGVAPFVKQLGAAWAKTRLVDGRSVYALGDRKGGRWEHWPADLRIREFPGGAR